MLRLKKKDYLVIVLASILIIGGAVICDSPEKIVGNHEIPSISSGRESCFTYAQRKSESAEALERNYVNAVKRMEREKSLNESMIKRLEKEIRIEQAADGYFSASIISSNKMRIKRLNAEIQEMSPDDFMEETTKYSYFDECADLWRERENRVVYFGLGMIIIGLLGVATLVWRKVLISKARQ